MSPKKHNTRTRGSAGKGKYISTVVHESSSSSNNENIVETNNLDTLAQTMANIDSEILGSLRGYGPSTASTAVPKFDPKIQEWHTFNLSLQHYLLMNNLLNQLKNPEITNANNLALFLAIANCLTGEALEIAQNDAMGDGQKLYKLLTQKYLGNRDAREATVLIEMCDLKLKENESIRDFIARVNKIKFQINEFKLIHKSNVLSTLVLRAIRDKFKIFVDNIYSSGKIPEWNTLKENLESYIAIDNIARSSKSGRNDKTIIANIHKKKFKRFMNRKYKCAKCFGTTHKTHECQSKLYCKVCDNRSHDYENCKYRGNNPHTTFKRPAYQASRGQGRRGRNPGGPRNNNHGQNMNNAQRFNAGYQQTNQNSRKVNTISNDASVANIVNNQNQPSYHNLYM